MKARDCSRESGFMWGAERGEPNGEKGRVRWAVRAERASPALGVAGAYRCIAVSAKEREPAGRSAHEPEWLILRRRRRRLRSRFS